MTVEAKFGSYVLHNFRNAYIGSTTLVKPVACVPICTVVM